jgi:plastocyanin
VIARTCAAAALLLLALPGLATADTKTVYMGPPPGQTTTQLQNRLNTDVNNFFPHSVAINVGDSIRFVVAGFHSFDFPPRGGAQLPLLSAAGEVTGVNDEAGAPFWFNGRDSFGFTRALGPPGAFGRRLVYNGRRRAASGLPLADRPKPSTVRFTRAGRFRYLCNVHPGMDGVVNVRRQGARVPSRRADRRAVRNQLRTSLRRARQLPNARPPAGVINVGVAGRGGEEFFGFVPDEVTVPSGTTLRFRMSPWSYDLHTATTGPGNPEDQPNSYLGTLAASFTEEVIDPRALYQSEQPPARATLTPTLHGNGFWSTGVMDRAGGALAGLPLPGSNSVQFGTPGTYTFFCLIHPFMRGTVIVQ